MIVVEPVRRSLETALRIHKLATDIGVTRFFLVGNKVKDADDLQFIETYTPQGAASLSQALEQHQDQDVGDMGTS